MAGLSGPAMARVLLADRRCGGCGRGRLRGGSCASDRLPLRFVTARMNHPHPSATRVVRPRGNQTNVDLTAMTPARSLIAGELTVLWNRAVLLLFHGLRTRGFSYERERMEARTETSPATRGICPSYWAETFGLVAAAAPREHVRLLSLRQRIAHVTAAGLKPVSRRADHSVDRSTN